MPGQLWPGIFASILAIHMLDIEFLTFEDVCEIHDRALREFGEGEFGFLDENAVRSAAGQPEAAVQGHYFHEFPAGMAAAYLYYLANQQGFRNGNKRAAVGSALEFLARNGYALTATPFEVYTVTKKLAGEDVEGSSQELRARLQDWIEEHLIAIPDESIELELDMQLPTAKTFESFHFDFTGNELHILRADNTADALLLALEKAINDYELGDKMTFKIEVLEGPWIRLDVYYTGELDVNEWSGLPTDLDKAFQGLPHGYWEVRDKGQNQDGTHIWYIARHDGGPLV
ncbi:MAG: Fic family protein [Tepidisphaeraceae bacterium]